MGLFAMPSCDVLDQYPHNATSQDNLSEEDIDLLFVGLYCYSQYKPTFTGYFLNDFAGGDFRRGGGAGSTFFHVRWRFGCTHGARRAPHREGLRQPQQCDARAARRLVHSEQGRLRGDHGRLGIRQVDAAQLRVDHRQGHGRQRARQRRGRYALEGTEAYEVPSRAARLHLPGFEPARHAHRT